MSDFIADFFLNPIAERTGSEPRGNLRFPPSLRVLLTPLPP